MTEGIQRSLPQYRSGVLNSPLLKESLDSKRGMGRGHGPSRFHVLYPLLMFFSVNLSTFLVLPRK